MEPLVPRVLLPRPAARRHHWVVESDLNIKRKHIRLGVQENRVTKYFDDAKKTVAASFDFGLTPEQEKLVLSGALGLVSEGIRYSLREIAGTVWAMRHAGWCPKENLLAREQAFYCSSFVRHVFAQAGVDLARGIAEKNTAPEHIADSDLPHTRWLMLRGKAPASRVKRIVKGVRLKLKRD